MKKILFAGMRVAVFFYCCALLIHGLPANGRAEPEERKIKSADRNRITLDNGLSVQLIGVDMKNMSSAKKPAVIFGDEVNRFMKKLAGQTVYLEYDPAFEMKGHREGGNTLAYLYYLTPTDHISTDGSQGLSAKPVLMVEAVKTEGNQLKAQMKPHLKVFLNSELIERGYARADRSREYRYKNDFLLSERKAQLAKAGVWE